MKVTTISDLRANIAEMFDAIVTDDEELVVTRNGRPAMVVMTKAEYDSWRETEYLLRGENGKELRRRLASPDAPTAHALIPDEELDGAA